MTVTEKNRDQSESPLLYFFSEPIVGTPERELEAVFAKKLETRAKLGEQDQVALLKKAYELARSRLVQDPR